MDAEETNSENMEAVRTVIYLPRESTKITQIKNQVLPVYLVKKQRMLSLRTLRLRAISFPT